ncbi:MULTISPECIES: N-succinylarginine dihydrolase [Sphingobium]|jgi:succinylarginine dihydrolase|uniref:N-succinylarginine dihydrolase n=1 Tax=Sphingobium TaxID=165695 RepID=UPI000DBB770E|nr:MULTISPECIES: N-succinylarginine dihydrolase [Sphingobium]KAA9018484.1 N-succinylarginine dihydrolase [Sphingobium limneticum]MBU0933869.1 N-succinylarginine dihydrolase [Alphaproteobacteria bacterium]BBC99775.1 succinylarginine dihydrolase [Sphingobium sp. YG1]
MSVREINFDGIIGPSHNYAGLSLGNLASARNAGGVSHPRAAALQGLEKMRGNIRLGLTQGIFLPQWRPDVAWLTKLGTDVGNAEPHIRAAAMSASSMWAANAATISPASDTADGRTHLTVANLVTMPHRSHEWPQTLAQLRIAFSDSRAFAVHDPVPAPFGDEGAANHMRLAQSHGEAGVEVFVYGRAGGAFPARQHVEASKAIARNHGLDPARTLFVEQSEAAIAAGAFHNDVVAVANEHVLFAHEQAFADKATFYADLRAALPCVEIVEVPASAVSLSDAIKSYLFNAQLVTLPDGDGMALILPTEAQETPAVWQWLEQMIAGNGSIRRLVPVDVRQSMANGGGPACLRLRVVADPADIDPRFLVDEARLDDIAQIVSQYWPLSIEPQDLGDTRLIARIEQSWLTLVDHLQLSGDLSP